MRYRRCPFGEDFSFTVVKPFTEHEETLAEIIDQGIDQGADGHFAVGADLCATAEGEQMIDLVILQRPTGQRLGYDIIREQIANHNLYGEADDELQGMGVPRKDDVLTA